MTSETMSVLNTLMQWVVAPVGAFVWFIYREQQRQATSIAVLQAQNETQKQAHDREIKEIRETMRAIMVKLDSIEEALRK